MKKIFLPILFLLLFASCSKYQKILKSPDLNFKFEKAVMYYENDDYNRALPLLEELSTIFRGSAKAEEVNYYYAYCHYSLGEYLMATYLFETYAQTYPNSKHTEECQYISAYCYYLLSPIYKLDSKNTYKAINHLQLFINLYPKSDRVARCNQLIDELREKLAKKAFHNAKQYYVTEYHKSAIIALKDVLVDFPGSKYEEEIYFLIIESSFELAKNSISNKKAERLGNTIDAYNEFEDRYPESKLLKAAQNTQQKTLKLIESLKKS
ncbi:MAG: outer membrane protein assembly factor BamD [Bacteroidota bacterium]|nr:outer membrane protein assembly factor BamD [Bacteroidota bacterium]